MNPLLTSGLDPQRGTTALSVNVNKVALLRNTRELGIPSVLRAATLALQAGAHGITVHPRPDERHIRAHDVYELADLMQQWQMRVLASFKLNRASAVAWAESGFRKPAGG